jgi:hypothetical protein
MDVLYTKIYELLETEKMFLCDKEAKEMDLKICENETKLQLSKKPSSDQRKIIRRKYNEMAQHFHVSTEAEYRYLGTKAFDYLVEFDIGHISDESAHLIKSLYLLLSRSFRLWARYKKLPVIWLKLGFMAGLLEDLVVVLRTPGQIGLGLVHLHSEDDILGIIDHLTGPLSDNSFSDRFLFLSHLKTLEHGKAKSLLNLSVKSQGESKRIGMHENICADETRETFYYALQGIFGRVIYDPRVITILSPGRLDMPKYAIHFTKEDIATKIWTKSVITSHRKREMDIEIGSICVFDRPIHALTCIEKTGLGFQIDPEMVRIRDRMVHGIDETKKRPKYQAGLVIDLTKLVSILEIGKVKMNELSTLLVETDIPHSCLVDLLHTEDQLNIFWRR